MIATILEILLVLLKSIPSWFKGWGRCHHCKAIIHRWTSASWWGKDYHVCMECHWVASDEHAICEEKPPTKTPAPS